MVAWTIKRNELVTVERVPAMMEESGVLSVMGYIDAAEAINTRLETILKFETFELMTSELTSLHHFLSDFVERAKRVPFPKDQSCNPFPSPQK